MGYRCLRCGGITTGDSSETCWEAWCECYRPRYKPYKGKIMKNRIEEIKERLTKVTHGTFKNLGDIYIFAGSTMVADTGNKEEGHILRARGVGGGMTIEQQKNNIEFFTHSKSDIKYLLKKIEKLEDEIRKRKI